MSPGFGAYKSAMTAPVSRPMKKPMAALTLCAPPRKRRAMLKTLAPDVALRDGEPDGGKDRAHGREQQLRVPEHADARSRELAGRLSDRHGGQREEPAARERARPAERRPERCRDADRNERE